jgi:hypothetical protein
MTLPPRHVGNSIDLSFEYPVEAADEWYVGAVVCHSAGLVVADNANADSCLGINLSRVTTTAANQLVTVHVKGVWWIAAAGIVTAALMGLLHPLATSDNPADMVVSGVGNPSCLGTIVHVGTTATDGYVDLDMRVIVVNT